ncbi:MAG: recombinase family protein [Chitinophagaceae bacterium]
MKKAIRYLRFSSDGQSQHSIERQDIVTSTWISGNSVLLTDTFKDEGVSARTFDRPDVKLLFDFIKKNYRNIDYLVVAELTRFSRETGDAINMVKQIQQTYGVRIVSAGRSMIYDCTDSNSFFMMGLEFLLGNSENIKRQTDINGGIYTAKAGIDGTGGRWIKGGPAPFGFIKDRSKKNVTLLIHTDQAAVIKYIFDAFLSNIPPTIIRREAIARGLSRTSNAAINEILINPLYMGHQYVKAWKDHPGGLFPIKDLPPIIAPAIWQRVQDKINKPQIRTIIDDDLPLRQVLNCFCGVPLTGAASKSRNGSYYLYYKCKHKGHNNISAVKAHDQLEEILKLLSIPEKLIPRLKSSTESLLDQKLLENKKILIKKERDFEQVKHKMKIVEDKFFNDQINAETYQEWHTVLNDQRRTLNGEIEILSRDLNQVNLLLERNLYQLSDMNHVYRTASTLKKQELVRQVFDSRLYYRDSIYRTAFIMPIFRHNLLILKKNRLLLIDGISENSGDVEVTGLLSNRFVNFLSLVQSIKVA